MKRLHVLLERDHNSLDFIRFAAAVAVIFYHAYPYALGYQPIDLVGQLTNNQLTLGSLAVTIFFIISGFLVAASMDRSQNAIAYVKARLLRIYPGLIVLVLVTIFVVGPLFTSMSLGDYFRDRYTFGYLKVLLLYNPVQYRLNDVFLHNAYSLMLNGSLWTLFWEMLCYGLVLALWLARGLNKRGVLLVLIALVFIYWYDLSINPYIGANDTLLQFIGKLLPTDVQVFVLMAVPFAGGMFFYFYRDQIVMRRRCVLLGIACAVPFIVLGKWLNVFWTPTFGVYILFYGASSPRSPFQRFARYGDFSYGMYIYAPLVHQSITYLFGGTMDPMLNFVLTATLTLIPAVLSWHLVEKPALRLKNFTFKRKHTAGEESIPVVTRM